MSKLPISILVSLVRYSVYGKNGSTVTSLRRLEAKGETVYPSNAIKGAVWLKVFFVDFHPFSYISSHYLIQSKNDSVTVLSSTTDYF